MIFCQQTAEKKTDVNIFHIFSCELLFDSILKIKMNPYTMKDFDFGINVIIQIDLIICISHIDDAASELRSISNRRKKWKQYGRRE